jgi:DNA-binding response OmpR family regulator
MRLLVVEDQKKMASFIRHGLIDSGYSVDTAESSAAAECMVAATEYDLVILDVMLPDKSGIDTARNMRRDGYVGPILMLTALSGTKNKVLGLDAGADDYLVKPFEFDELSARIRALLRRGSSTSGVGTKLNFEDLEIDLVQRKVVRCGQLVNLTTKEFALLEYLVRNASRVLSRANISEHVWDASFDSESNVIDVYVNMLRKKIDQPFPSRLIHTVVGMGYVLKRNE